MPRGVFDAALAERYKNPEKKLTNRVRYFCQFYAMHCNATQACIEAGYKQSRARDTGQTLLQNKYVKAYINELSATLFDKIGMSRQWLAEKYKEIIDIDITTIYNEDGALKTLAQIPDKTKRAIARIKVEELYRGKGAARENIGRNVELFFYDKLKAMDSVARMAGYNEEKSGVNISNSNVQMNFNDIRIVEVTLNL